jgi:hypothetical protein
MIGIGEQRRSERMTLTPEDAARLRMSVPENPMVIMAALLLERPLARDVLVNLVEARLLRHERFRRRIIEPRWGSPLWADGAELDHGSTARGTPPTRAAPRWKNSSRPA